MHVIVFYKLDFFGIIYRVGKVKGTARRYRQRKASNTCKFFDVPDLVEQRAYVCFSDTAPLRS